MEADSHYYFNSWMLPIERDFQKYRILLGSNCVTPKSLRGGITPWMLGIKKGLKSA